jgi:hypothetical protein
MPCRRDGINWGVPTPGDVFELVTSASETIIIGGKIGPLAIDDIFGTGILEDLV